MGGGKGGQTIGYHYILTLLWGDCRGPVNEYLAIEADDKLAWLGHVSDSTPTKINKPNLFGGEKKEGGIQGAFRLFQGARDQVLPGATNVVVTVAGGGPCPTVTLPDIKAAIGGRVSEMRGYVTGLYRGLVTSMNPYPKEWHFLRWRTSAGWFGGTCWYPAKATITLGGDGAELEPGTTYSGGVYGIFGSILRVMSGLGLATTEQPTNTIYAMNPAHIIYQVLTDPEWGASRSPDELDENSFILAANQLCAEGFGLCINWARQEDVDTFLQSVVDHIAAALYTDRTTGKLVLKLIRDDYVVDDLPLYDFNSGLLEVEEDDSGSSDEMINEIIVKGKDQTVVGRGKDIEVHVHNNAARQSQGAISDTLDLPGIPTRALAFRRGQMELKIHAPGLKRFKLKFDRRAWQLTPAGVIRISAPTNGIANMVVRLGNDIDYGDTTDGTITASAVEDVFGLPEASFQVALPGTWVPPQMEAAPAAATRLIEAGYRDIVKHSSTADAQGLDPTAAFIGELAQSPGYAYEYDLLSRVVGEPAFVDRAGGSFTDASPLVSNIAALDTDIVVTDASVFSDFVDEALLIGNEVVRLDAVDTTTNTLTIARGCADTIPAPHSAGDLVWLLDDDLASDRREYASGETVETRVLTRTNADMLDESEAATDSATMVARHYKPYPPGDVQIDGVSIYELTGAHPAPVLTFTDRDRLSEDDQLIEHGAGSVGPEAGTTYTLRVKSADGTTLLRTETVTSGWTYDGTMQTADGDPTSVLMELESTRDGVASWQTYSFTVILLSGYGDGYGYNYGGA